MASYSNHNFMCDRRLSYITSDRVEITHTKEQGKDDYIINPKMYFEDWILQDNSITFKTADEKRGRKMVRVIYPVRKHKDHEYSLSSTELRFLKDDKVSSGKICVMCLNAVPLRKKEERDFKERLACVCCSNWEVRDTIKPIVKVNTTH